MAAALLPAPAAAEIVTDQSAAAVLAVGRAGAPTVAYLDREQLVVTTRTSAGWRPARVRLPLPATEADVVSAAVGPDGRAAVLVQDTVRRAVVVVWRRPARWLVVQVARLSQSAQLGISGLALDTRGRPIVAYAFRRPSGNTFLRLARIDGRGRVQTTAITKLGFPASTLPPSAVPHVTPSGVVRVVEAYTSAVIDWFRERGKWTGQYLFASRLGSPVGRVLAVAGARGAVVAWTQEYPTFGEAHVLLQQGAPTGDVADLLPHARLAALAVVGGSPEVGANDWVEIDGWETSAGLLAFPDQAPVELDGRVDGYAAGAGTRQLLLATDHGLEWFRLQERPAVRVTLAVDDAGHAIGHVEGADTGSVAIVADSPDTGRVVAATVALAADGSFVAEVAPPRPRSVYRAVFRDPASGVPYAALLRRTR